MTDVVTRLVVRADGSLATLDRFEKGMGNAGKATDYASGAVASFERRMEAARQAIERGNAVATQTVARKSQEERAWEKWSATVDRTTALRVRLERESAHAAVAASNAVNAGYATQEQALSTLMALEARHAAQLSAHIAAENGVAVAYTRRAAAADQAAASTQRLNAANQNSQYRGAGNFNTANVAAQFQDIGVTAAMGMSPVQIALQQGTQLSAVLGGQGLTGVVRTLGAAFGAILSPVSLITIGVVALAATGIQAFMNMTGSAEDATEALKGHNDELDKILEGYDLARSAAQGFFDAAARRPEGAVASDLLAGRENSAVELRASYDALYEEQQRIIASFGDLAYSGDLATIELVRGFGEVAISAGTSSQELDAMLVALTQIANNNDYTAKVRKYVTDLLPFIEAIIRGRSEVGSFDTALRMLPKEVNIRLNLQSASDDARSDLLALYQDPRSSFDILREQAGLSAEAASNTATSYSQAAQIGEDYLRVMESIDAAEAAANAKTSEKAAAAANKPVDQWSGNVAQFQQRIAAQQLEIELMGQSTYEVERQKAAFDLLNQAKQAGIPITSQVTDQINLMSAEYASATVQLERMNQAANDNAALWSQAQDGVSGIIKTWVRGGDVLAGISDRLLNIADMLVDMAVRDLFGGAFGGGTGGGGIFSWLGGLLGFASGGVFSAGRVQPFARGGVVNSPTLFPMANGAGLMGEAGPEAIMPLRRGADGRLGVAANQNGGHLSVRVISEVRGGNLVPVMTEIAGEVSGQQIRQAAPVMVGEAVGQANKSAPAAIARYQQQRVGADYRTA